MSKLLVCLSALAIGGCVINFKSPIPERERIHVDAHYVYPGKNEFNSAEKYYKKELTRGHFAQTHIELDPGQQLLVLNKAIVLHFYQMPDSFYHSDDTLNGQPHFLRIWADSLDKTVRWYGSIIALEPANYDLKGLMEYVDSIVKSSDNYQDLPKSKLTGD